MRHGCGVGESGTACCSGRNSLVPAALACCQWHCRLLLLQLLQRCSHTSQTDAQVGQQRVAATRALQVENASGQQELVLLQLTQLLQGVVFCANGQAGGIAKWGRTRGASAGAENARPAPAPRRRSLAAWAANTAAVSFTFTSERSFIVSGTHTALPLAW